MIWQYFSQKTWVHLSTHSLDDIWVFKATKQAENCTFEGSSWKSCCFVTYDWLEVMSPSSLDCNKCQIEIKIKNVNPSTKSGFEAFFPSCITAEAITTSLAKSPINLCLGMMVHPVPFPIYYWNCNWNRLMTLPTRHVEAKKRSNQFSWSD